MSHADSVVALRNQFQNLRKLYFLSLVFSILALVVFFVDPRLTLVLLGVSLLMNLTLVRKKSRAYTDEFIRLSSQITLERHLEDAKYSPQSVLSEAAVREARMLPSNAAQGSVLCRQGGTGVYKGHAVTLGDVTLAHTFTPGKKKRHNFVIGTWVTVALGTDTGLDCRFISETALPDQSIKEMLWVETDLNRAGNPLTLRSGWHVICRKDCNAMPSDGFLKQLEKLHRKTNGRIAVCIQGDKLHIMLIGEFLAQKVSGRMAPSDQFAQADLLPTLSSALLLCDFLAI